MASRTTKKPTSTVVPAEMTDIYVESRGLPVWKRAMDIVGAAVGLIVAAPLLLLIALAIVIDDRATPFYQHARVGRGGRCFTAWKFRSMHVGADLRQAELAAHNEANGHIFKMKNDPRRTRVGKFLRKTSLDELPQLWNVLRGDMTLVGPRPPLPSEVALYEEDQLARLGGVPGITGRWQVSARDRHDFDQMLELDVEYLQRITFWGDVKILARTIPTVLFGRGSY